MKNAALPGIRRPVLFAVLHTGPWALLLFLLSLSASLAQDDFYQKGRYRSRFVNAEANATGQPEAMDSLIPDRDLSESGLHPTVRGYWRLRTEYVSRRTLIQIFNSEKKLVYQEQLPGKYLKLNRRNTQMLDKLCDRLLSKQLIAANLVATELPLEIGTGLYDIPPLENHQENAIYLPLNTATLQAGSYMDSEGKMNTIFVNPTRRLISIKLRNENGELLYDENSALIKYKRTFDLNGVPAGTYTLKIAGAGEQYVQQFRIRYASSKCISEWIPQPRRNSTRPGAPAQAEPLVEWHP